MMENESICPNLSLKKRLIGFAVCCVVAMCFTTLSLFMLFKKQYAVFAVCFSLSNVIALASTMFLVGPKKQFKKMLHPSRLVSFCVFVGAMIGTLICAFTIKNTALIIVLCIVQWLAFIWYSLSFVPCAQKCVKSLCQRMLGV
eukprot:TRINITY_DN17356_c0_g1_i1.p1 TRINITY_DN17356_c0_g1~~TRINITY_DN17356_c0_g1_i1.p1  ORF type:complete len:168 (-),score=26.05 TRINITY_DN17356_c0_g1_i1:28-456(-)